MDQLTLFDKLVKTQRLIDRDQRYDPNNEGPKLSMQDLLLADRKLESLLSEIPAHSNMAGLICPYCNGGDKKEKSFSVTRNEYLALYICHRASCGVRGRRLIPNSIGGVITDAGVKYPDEPKYYKKATLDIPEDIEDLLLKKYHLTKADLFRADIKWAPDEKPSGRLYFPLRSYHGISWGCVLRSMDKKANPKSLTYLFKDGQGRGAWWVNHLMDDCVVVVEDPISAIRLQKYVTSVALLGTNLSFATVDDIKGKMNNKHGTILIALDKDATAQAIKLAIQYNLILPITVAMLDKDIKDMTDDELKMFLMANLPSKFVQVINNPIISREVNKLLTHDGTENSKRSVT